MPPVKLSKVTFTPPKPPSGAVGLVSSAAVAGADDAVVEIPSELVEKLWRAVDIVPGLTLETALTLALQQFLGSLPDDYEREDG